MKKVMSIVLILALLFTFGCQSGPKAPQEEVGDLKETIEQIVKDAGFPEMLEDGYFLDELDQEEAGFLIGAESLDGKIAEAYGLQPMINVNPFAMGIFRVAEGGDAVAFAKELKEKADLRKWICVEAETMAAASKGDAVFFVMGSQDEVTKLLEASGFTPVA